jgi:hypothetical protein
VWYVARSEMVGEIRREERNVERCEEWSVQSGKRVSMIRRDSGAH